MRPSHPRSHAIHQPPAHRLPSGISYSTCNDTVIEADFPRTVTAASVDGTNLELELACDPDTGSPFLYSMATSLNTWADPYELIFAVADGVELTSDGKAVTALNFVNAGKTTSADDWIQGNMQTSAGVDFNYISWDPEEDSKNLVVWLHGAGEGGTETHEVPTVERLKKSGKSADTLHVSTTEHVVDTSGQYFARDEEGNLTDQPYQYNGHWSWIYFDNNESACNEDGLKVFDFVAQCFA